jgi:hypothetical protein
MMPFVPGTVAVSSGIQAIKAYEPTSRPVLAAAFIISSLVGTCAVGVFTALAQCEVVVAVSRCELHAARTLAGTRPWPSRRRCRPRSGREKSNQSSPPSFAPRSEAARLWSPNSLWSPKPRSLIIDKAKSSPWRSAFCTISRLRSKLSMCCGDAGEISQPLFPIGSGSKPPATQAGRSRIATSSARPVAVPSGRRSLF